MRTANITDIIEAFRNDHAVFGSMKDVRLLTDDAGNIIFASERNSLLVGAEINGKPKVLRILLDENGIRERIIFNNSFVKQHPDAPVADMAFHEKELCIHDTYGCRKYLDVIEIDDEPVEILSLISQGDLQYGEENASIITGFMETVKWFVSHDLVIDRFNYDCCCFSEGSVKVSFVCDIGICKSPNNQTLNAFKNFALGMAVNMLLVIYGEQDSVNDTDEKFRLLNAVYYGSEEFTNSVGTAVKRLETYCGKEYVSIKRLLACDKQSESIRLINDVISEISAGCHTQYRELGPLFDSGRYEILGECIEDRIPVRDKNTGLCGYTSISGETDIQCEFEDVSDFYEGLAVVYNGGRFGAIDRSGKKVIPLQYEYLSWEKADNVFIFRLGEKYGLMDREGNIIAQTGYRHIDNFSNGRAIVKGSKDKFGLINRNGREVLRCEYDSIEPFNGTMTVAVKNGEKKTIDIFGDIVGEEDL